VVVGSLGYIKGSEGEEEDGNRDGQEPLKIIATGNTTNDIREECSKSGSIR